VEQVISLLRRIVVDESAIWHRVKSLWMMKVYQMV